MADKRSRVLLQYQTDKAALRAFLVDSAKIRGEMKMQAELAKQVDLATVKVGKSIRDAFGSRSSGQIAQFAGNMKGAVQSTDDLTKALEETVAAQEELNKTAAEQQKGGGGSLSRITGAAGRAAGAVSPGLGSALRDIQDIQEFGQSLGDISKAAIGAGVGIGAATLALSLLQAQAQKIKEAAAVELNSRAEVIGFIQTATQDEIKARIDELKQRQAINKAIADDANSVYQQLDSQTNIIGKIDAALGTGAGELSAAKENADKANAALGETNTALSLLQQAADANFAPTEKLAEKEKELADIRAKATEDAIKYVVDQKRFELEASRLTTDQIAQRKQSIEDEIALTELELDARTKAGLETDDLITKWAALGQQEAYLTGTATELAKANDEAAASEKKRADSIAAVQKYNTDVAALEQRSLEQRAALQDKYNQSLISIAQQAADAADNALQKLEDQRAKLLQDFQRNEADEQKKAELERQDKIVQFQRDEAKALRDHVRDLQKIREDAAEREFDLILNRDFAGLFASRRQTTQDINASNEQFNQERQDRLEAFKQELQDQIDQYARDREARIAKYQQDLADAQAQYNRERQQIEVNRRAALQKAAQQYQQELNLAGQKYRAELSARQQAITAELQMIQQGNQAKLQLEAQYWAQAQQILQNALSGGSSGGGGGGFQPGAAGFQSSVNSGRGGAQVNITQHITGGANANSIASAVDSRIESTLRQIFPKRSGAR